jgi:hypothetical protein
VLRSCWLRRLVLLPRFQRYVQEDLGAAPPAVRQGRGGARGVGGCATRVYVGGWVVVEVGWQGCGWKCMRWKVGSRAEGRVYVCDKGRLQGGGRVGEAGHVATRQP